MKKNLPASGTGSASKRRSRSRTSRGKPRRGSGRPPSRTEGIERAIARTARDACQDLFGSTTRGAIPFTFEIRGSIDPAGAWRVEAHPSLEEQIREAVREMASRVEAFQAGHVYCYRCESPSCAHGFPPAPTSVFLGYSSTGLPVWGELSQVLLERKHPHLERLYGDSSGGLLAVYLDGETLKKRQLNVFGRQSKTYDILGQVVVGYLHLRPPASGGRARERAALTLQAVEYRALDGSPRISMNVLGRLSDGSPAVEALQGAYQARISDLITGARLHLDHLLPTPRSRAGGRPKGGPDPAPAAAAILKALTRKLEKIGRQWARRTAHAERRRVNNRPTSTALEDVLHVPLAEILWDKEERTFVVPVRRGRVHVFSSQGRHVTSLVLSPEAVRARRRKGRWIPLTRDQQASFVSTLENRAGPSRGRNEKGEEQGGGGARPPKGKGPRVEP